MINPKEETLFEYANKIINVCNNRNLKTYDGFVPLIPELYSEEYSIFFDAKISDLITEPNVSVLNLGNPNGIGAKKECQFMRFSEVTPKYLRKKCGLFAPKPYLLEVAYETRATRAIVPFYVKNNNLTILEPPNLPPIIPAVKSESYSSVQVLLGVQFNLENQPYVYLKPDNAEIGFTLPIDNLSQLKELFSLRDIPDGYTRRVALLHWVAKHLRRKPSNHEERIEVKQYLRGHTNFEWLGIKGTIFNN